VSSDLDFVIMVHRIMVHRGNLPVIRRSIGVDTSAPPVAADVQVYTQAEWARLAAESPHVRARYQREMMDLPGVA
jgi:hypothetical protein